MLPHPPPFRFKQFVLHQEGVAHPVGTDSVLLGALTDLEAASTILDIGTGTGAVALMLAQRLADESRVGRIQGIDIHEASARCARENASRSPWKESVAISCCSVQEYAKECQTAFDLIVSNPPFFSDLTVSPDEIRRMGRYTGTLSPGDLLDSAKFMLKEEGRFVVILPVFEAKRLCEMAGGMGLYWTKITEIQSLPDKATERWIVEFRKTPHGFRRDRLLIYSAKNEYSEAYKLATRAFYLHF